jgi:hypothetical protein
MPVEHAAEICLRCRWPYVSQAPRISEVHAIRFFVSPYDAAQPV